MADALISPVVGGAMWAVTGALTAYSAKKLNEELDERKAPLMGILGAFIFSAQMINFSIPGTGSSGHLGGGMILAILLGPYAAFLAIASVIAVQALFFADGGLLALGCNIFNLGFFPCFVAYPLIYRKIAGGRAAQGRILTASVLSAIVGLQMGAFSVVLETVASGVSELPFALFTAMMLPIHLAIGAIEGLVTSAVVSALWKVHPEFIERTPAPVSAGSLPIQKALLGLGLATLFAAGVFSWFASTHPDGLEWSMARVAGAGAIKPPDSAVRSAIGRVQEKTALLPDYDFKQSEAASTSGETGTSIAGLVGAGLTLALAGILGVALKKRGPEKCILLPWKPRRLGKCRVVLEVAR